MMTLSWILILTSFLIYASSTQFMNLSADLTSQFTNMENLVMIFLIIIAPMIWSNMEKTSKIMIVTLLTATTAIFYSSSIFITMLILEVTLIPTTFLMMTLSKGEDKTKSSMMMLGFNGGLSLLMLVFMNYLFSNMNEKMSMTYLNFETSKILSNLTMLIFIALMLTKMPMFLAHFWLNKAHVTAYSPVSMFLAGIMLKLGTIALMKTCYFYALTKSINMSNFYVSYSLMSCVFIFLFMFRSFDLKLYVALSSITHMAMLFPMLISYNPVSVQSSVLMMMGHGLTSMCLFFMLSYFYEKTQNRSMSANKNEDSSSKIMSFWLILSLMNNLGLPPFMNFLSEMLTLEYVNEKSLAFSLVFCTIMLISALHCFNIMLTFLFSKSQKSFKKMSSNITSNLIIFFLNISGLFYICLF